MKLKHLIGLSLIMGMGLLTTGFSAPRVVVCEELYQED